MLFKQAKPLVSCQYLCNVNRNILGTPDFRSEESDSSSGSAFKRNTAEATKKLTYEWEQIERTLYDEVGEKSSRPQILEECKQWRQLHPQLRYYSFFTYFCKKNTYENVTVAIFEPIHSSENFYIKIFSASILIF